MDKYEQIEALGSFIVEKKRSVRSLVKGAVATTQKRTNSSRVSIRMTVKTAESVGLEKGCYCNLALLPSGKYCLCKVRDHLGYILTTASSTPNTLYCFIPYVETVEPKAIGKVEDGLILFPEGSFNALPVSE